MILDELKAVMPSFVSRVERPDRGGEWIAYLESRARAGERWARRLGLDEHEPAAGPSVRLLRVEGDEEDLLAALLFESSACSEEAAREAIGSLDGEERAELLADLIGHRANRRHRPGRGLESIRYRFEIVSDYGAFRDLQRHRMLTVQWQALSPALGAGVPEQVELAGCGQRYRRALEISSNEYHRLVANGLATAAPYALCLGFRIRYILDLNAREAMQLIELRSGREGHPSYRAVAHEMHAQIASVHPAVAVAMVHVDRETEPRLERILSEMRSHAKAAAGELTVPPAIARYRVSVRWYTGVQCEREGRHPQLASQWADAKNQPEVGTPNEAHRHLAGRLRGRSRHSRPRDRRWPSLEGQPA